MFQSTKIIFIILTFGILFTGVVFPSQADDFLTIAAGQYRNKDFAAAYISAGKSSNISKSAFLRGMSAFRLNRFAEAVTLLADAEKKLPIIGDYALFYQAQALQKLKQYPAAILRADSIHTSYPSSKLLKRSERLIADIRYEFGDYRTALESYRAYIKKYPFAGDSVKVRFLEARCKEELTDINAAVSTYRNIWISTPVSSLAEKAQERLKLIEVAGYKVPPYSPDELFKRASAQYSRNAYSDALKTLGTISTNSISEAMKFKIRLKIGKTLYRLKRYSLAEKQFSDLEYNSEARFWLAKSKERQNLKDSAFLLYMKLAAEGKKQEYATDAVIEAAGLKRSLGEYSEAAHLFEQAAKIANDSKTIDKAVWDAGWCSYLSGEQLVAAEAFKKLLSNEKYREKSLYWIGKIFEKRGDSVSSRSFFNTLVKEFPAGFYATWYRELNGIKDDRESFGNRDTIAALPWISGFDKPRLLGSLGLIEEARIEMFALRKLNGEKKSQFPAIGKIYLEIKDYGMAIYLFSQNKPFGWSKENLPTWSVGYPIAYSELVSRNAAINHLSEGLVYALIRAESGFSPTIKSGAGAIGLMQMMPATAKMTAHEKGAFNPQRLTVPEYNIRLGTKHLNDLMKEHNGDLVYMAAAYNAGSGALGRWKKNFKGLQKDEFIESIPYQETREYVKKVYASAATYRKLYGIN